ncbi:MAG: hypothetical protein DRR16_00605 [Candidatus Parabeggiatoa sp. nov. 3]|nr:MAG: hypothetical protein DRR00_01825 [Gammaproteobacteria bacterium]RKZ69510.1 MAG: hypothetical protein DRQ99_00780 [Gammaproteobacteria bacterium]RKZ90124.1 MAG: hypothetical protein DRR16_00605 [Gammaproteobacteria bacterium]
MKISVLSTMLKDLGVNDCENEKRMRAKRSANFIPICKNLSSYGLVGNINNGLVGNINTLPTLHWWAT